MKNQPIGITLSTLLFAGAAFGAQYKIDASHSNIGFKVKHLAISTVRGNFGQFEGTLEFNPEKQVLENAKATIVTKSIDTKEPKRDKHLASEDFFGAEKHPKITFDAKEAKLKKGKGKVKGNLTIKGVTKPVTLDIEYQGAAKDPWGNEKVAFTGSTTINRKDFDIKWNEKLDNGGLVVSEEVDIILDIEANLVKTDNKSKKS
ncbi:MAG: polyisoprenoid-binding protein [Bdellovibrionales bacterium]|nr:polyisoprenoid-binding protein [Bdellovibrionales bacterium]